MEQHHDTLRRVLGALGILIWGGIILYAFLHRADFTLENILHYTPESPLLAAVVLLLLFAVKSLTVFFYSGILFVASGVLFPTPAAILLNVCGTLVMAMIPYFFARSVGARRADELREKHPRLKDFEKIRSRNNFAFVVVLRCVNVVNYDIGSMYCGAVRLPRVPFLLGSVLGKLTDIILLSIMGANLDDPTSAPFLIALAIDLSIALCVVLWSKKQNKKETETL